MKSVIAIDVGTGRGKAAILWDSDKEAEWLLPPEIPQVGMPTVAYVAPNGDIKVNLSPDKRSGYARVDNVKTYLGKSSIDKEVNGVSFSVVPEKVYGALALELVRLANETLKKQNKEPVYRVALTHPVNFVDKNEKLKLIKHCVEELELDGHKIEVVAMISEPAAAAVDAMFHARNLSCNPVTGQKHTMMIYDLGHGTFDVAVVTSVADKSKPFDLVDMDGDPEVGGRVFDNKICGELYRQLEGCELSARDRADLEQTCAVKIKHSLSDTDAAYENFFVGSDFVQLGLKRARFEEMIAQELNATLECLHTLMQNVEEKGVTINEIVLTGGSSRIPAIERMLKEAYGSKGISVRGYRPEHAVVLGAARYAYDYEPVSKPERTASEEELTTLKQKQGISNPTLSQHAEYAYGIRLGDEVVVLIKAGADLPAVSESVSVYSGSGRLGVDVRRSQEKGYAKDNMPFEESIEVRRFAFDVPTDVETDITLSLDENRCVSVYCQCSDGVLIKITSFDI